MALTNVESTLLTKNYTDDHYFFSAFGENGPLHPVDGETYTSTKMRYGDGTLHGVDQGTPKSIGIDLAPASNSPKPESEKFNMSLYLPLDAFLTPESRIGWYDPKNHKKDWGYRVELYRPNGDRVIAAYLDENSAQNLIRLQEQMRVRGVASLTLPRGIFIGTMGNTGSVSSSWNTWWAGTHLHFEYRRKDRK